MAEDTHIISIFRHLLPTQEETHTGSTIVVFLLFYRLLALLSHAQMSISVHPPVVRHNFGVVFYPQTKISSALTQYIKFNITTRVKLKPPSYQCIQNSTTLLAGKLELLNIKIDFLTNLINENYIYKRHKRALLAIGGKLLKYLFGVETEDEMHVLRKHLNILDARIHDDKHYMISRDKLIARLAKSHHKLGEHLKVHIEESIDLFNRHDDNLINFKNFSTQLLNSLKTDRAIHNCLWKIIQTEQHAKYLLDMIYGLEHLYAGRLTKSIMPVDQLLTSIDYWDNILFQNYSLNIGENSSDFYYNNKLATNIVMHLKHVTYQLNIPAIIHKSNVMLYSIRKFDIPAFSHSPSQTGYTKLTNEGNFISLNATHYALHHSKYESSFPTIYRHFNSVSCFSEIFLDTRQNYIHKLCNFELFSLRHANFDQIPINMTSHILISPPKQGVMQCETHITDIDLPPMTIINIPCGCSLKTSDFDISNPLTFCIKSQNFTISTGINLPIFATIDLDSNKINGKDLFNIKEPIIKTLHENFTTELASIIQDQEYVRDIYREGIKLVKHDKIVIDHSNIEWITKIRDNGPNIASTILSAISLAISFYLLYRLNGLFALLIGFKKVLGANLTMTQWEVPNFSLNFSNDSVLASSNSSESPIGNTYEDARVFSPTSGMATAFLISLLLLAGLIIYKVVKCAKQCKVGKYHIIGPSSNHVYLKLDYAGDTFAFSVCPIYHHIDTITLPKCPKVQSIRAHRFLSREISVAWTDANLLEYWAQEKLHTVAFGNKFSIPKGCRSLVRTAVQSGACRASLCMADAHGNTLTLRRDAHVARGTTSWLVLYKYRHDAYFATILHRLYIIIVII